MPALDEADAERLTEFHRLGAAAAGEDEEAGAAIADRLQLGSRCRLVLL
jgi:hypothetical protein